MEERTIFFFPSSGPFKLSKPGAILLSGKAPGRAEQFSLRVLGGKVFGRGVKLMKSGVLAFLQPYREAWRSSGVPPVSILLTSDDIVAGATVQRLLGNGTLGGSAAITPDNGAKDQIVVEQKGLIWAKLVAKATKPHVLQSDAENPNLLLVDAIERLRTAFPREIAGEWRLTVEVTRFLGETNGHRVDQVSGSAACAIEVRFPPGMTAAEAAGLVLKELPNGCRIDVIHHGSPINTDPKLPLVNAIERIAMDVTQHAVPVGRSPGPSDARFLAEHGIHPVMFAPVGGGQCSDEEWVSVESLRHHVEINRRLISELNSM